MGRLASHACYFVPHGTLQFLLATPIAVVPAMLRDGRLGVSEAWVDLALSLGTGANAVGKMVNGMAIDAVGPRIFASATLAAATCSLAVLSASSRQELVLGAWVCLQFAASGGWLIGCRVIHDRFGRARWSSCFAVLSAASRGASMTAKLSLGALLVRWNWHEIGLTSAAIGIVGWMVVARLLATPVTAGYDAVGSASKSLEASDNSRLATLRRLLCDRGLLLYSAVIAGATCVAGFENMTPLALDDLTSLAPAAVTTSATVFPAALLLGVATVPPLLSRLDKRASKPRAAFSRLLAELALLAVAFASALAIAFLANRARSSPAAAVLPCVVGLAFGVSITFYITPNIYALDFGGEDCATASAILDTCGLVASSLWALSVSAIQRASPDHYAAWTTTMVILAAIIGLTALISVAAHRATLRQQDRRDLVLQSRDCLPPQCPDAAEHSRNNRRNVHTDDDQTSGLIQDDRAPGAAHPPTTLPPFASDAGTV